MQRASASSALTRALQSPELRSQLSVPLHVIAAGKAASTMVAAIAADPDLDIKLLFAAGTHADAQMPAHVEWHEAAHPVPDARSVTAATRACQIARTVHDTECLLLLLSGGASAVLALPADGVSFEQKQQTIHTMLLAGADIHALNTVRKHLSSIKGGRLAAMCRGAIMTLAVSDVIGDDLSVIGSGPAVADLSTWEDAQQALDRFGGATHLPAVREHIARGRRGEVPDTPKPGSPQLARASARVIAARADAVAGARAAAASRGYAAIALNEAVAGVAREVAGAWWREVKAHIAATSAPVCVISAGETTVRVTGQGRGGRNQEFALALAEMISANPREMIAASIGTDGIDGPTDAAGAMVDRTSVARAGAQGLSPRAFLDDNNSYEFFDRLSDLIRLGPTDTNVGDIQILLAP